MTYQLLACFPHVRDIFVQDYGSKLIGGYVEEWTINELKGFVREVISDLQGNTLTIYVDALDESDDDIQTRELVSFLENLSDVAQDVEANLRVCLSSRHFPHITIKKGLALIVDDQSEHSDDIETYVGKELVTDREEHWAELRAKILRKSNGIFLWVVLVVQILNKVFDRGRAEEMLQYLEQVPETLDGLYTDILSRRSGNLGHCVLLLQWVLFARRPLTMKELYTALISEARAYSGHIANLPSMNTIEIFLLDNACGLVEFSGPEPRTVQFIHETVQKFIHCGGLNHHLDAARSFEGQSHDKIKEGCFKYLNAFKIHAKIVNPARAGISIWRISHADMENNSEALRIIELPLLDYATRYMFDHSNAAQEYNISQYEFIQAVDLTKWLSSWQLLRNSKAPRFTFSASLVYILAEFGYEHLVRICLEDPAIDLWSNERFGTPLQAACAAGHTETVRLLLKRGVDVNINGGEARHALIAAIIYKHDQIVKLLMQEKPTPKPWQKDLNWALFYCVGGQNLQGISTLLSLGANVNGKNKKGSTPALVAVRQSNAALHDSRKRDSSSTKIPRSAKILFDDIVRILLTHNVDMTAHDSYDLNVLAETVDSDNIALMRVIIQRESSIYRSNPWSQEVLERAFSTGSEEMLTLLIKEGFGFTTNETVLCSAFELAAFHGKQSIVELLIEQGAHIDEIGPKYGTALHAAVLGAREELARWLIQHKADMNSELGFFGNTAQTAAYQGHVGIMQMLAKHGANVKETSGKYGPALHVAAFYGHIEIVMFLVEQGVSVHASAKPFNTALGAAVRGGHVKMVNYMIESGADVTVDCGTWGTALHAAARGGYIEVVRLLIARGANVNNTSAVEYGTALHAVLRPHAHERTSRWSVLGPLNEFGTSLVRETLGIEVVIDHEETVRVLLENGANVETQDPLGQTPLYAASRTGFKVAVELLLAHGAEVNRTAAGPCDTALGVAVNNLDRNTVKVLLDHGADMDARSDPSGESHVRKVIARERSYNTISSIFGCIVTDSRYDILDATSLTDNQLLSIMKPASP